MNKTMYSYQSRLDSFTPASRLKSSSKGSSTVKWPHPPSILATPTALASAGFYYESSLGHDTVICFMCGKQLAEWEPNDDPAVVHAEKCPHCPWVILKCVNDVDKNGSITFTSLRIPSSETMFKSRLATFGLNGQTFWPHDVKNRGPSSETMATAGFIYTPVNNKDDTCTCIYCGIELRGWKRNDDPIEEHRGRQSQCPFFTEPAKEIARARGRPKLKNSVLSNETAISDKETNEAQSSSRSTRGGTGTRQNRIAKAKQSSSRKGNPKRNEDVVMEYEVAVTVDHDDQRKGVRRGKPSRSKSTSRSRSARGEVKETIPDPSDSERQSQHSRADNVTVPQSSARSSRKLSKDTENKRKGSRSQRSRGSEKRNDLIPDETKHSADINNIVVQSNDPMQLGIDMEMTQEEQQLDLQAEKLTLLEERTFSPLPNRVGDQIIPISSVVEPTFLSGLSSDQLTEFERGMTVEMWIRNEMEREYERLKADGRNKIDEFIGKAAEVARQIENL